MNEDFLDLLGLLLRAGARFLVVGAHAMAVHGVPRATGDLDVWVDPDPANADRVWRALLEFGAPAQEMGVHAHDGVSQKSRAPERGPGLDQALQRRGGHALVDVAAGLQPER